MEPSDLFIVIAEVAVGLAGFSGVVVTLGRQRSGSWEEDERLRFTQLLCLTLGCALFAILPLTLMLSPLSINAILRICGIPAALFFASVVSRSVFRVLNFREEIRSRFNMPLTMFIGAGTFLVSLVALIDAAGVSKAPSLWIYAAMLVWVLLVSGFQFLRIVLLGMDSSRGS